MCYELSTKTPFETQTNFGVHFCIERELCNFLQRSRALGGNIQGQGGAQETLQ